MGGFVTNSVISDRSETNPRPLSLFYPVWFPPYTANLQMLLERIDSTLPLNGPVLWVSEFANEAYSIRVQFDVYRVHDGYDAYLTFYIARKMPGESCGKFALNATVHDLETAQAREEIKWGSLTDLTLSEMNVLAHALRTVIGRIDEKNQRFIERAKRDSVVLQCLLN